MPGPLQPSALANAELLRTLDSDAPPATIHALAEAISATHVGTLNRTIDRLADDGLVERAEKGAVPTLTPEGHHARRALDFAEGLFDVPEDHILVAGDKLRPHPENPREDMDAAELETLADTIEADGRISQNLIIGPADENGVHTIFIGHRRHAAWTILKRRGSPVADQPLPCVQRQDEPGLIDYLSLVENGQRANLNHLERAQALARLAERRGYGNPTLAKVTGVDLRTVQESLKVVREAAPESLAKYRAGLKPGADRASTFTWEQLRDSVKDSKPKESLQLTAKLKLPLIELAWAIRTRPATVYRAGYTQIEQPEPGGAYHTLRDRQLIGVGFDGGQTMFACISPEVTAWLTEIGFNADPAGVLLKAQQDVIGPLEADVLARDGRFATDWLNVPSPAEEVASSVRTIGAGPDLRTDDADPAPEAVDGVEAYAALAGQKLETPEGGVRPPVVPDVPALSPAEELILVELAHKIASHPIKAPNQLASAAEVHDYFKDAKAMAMVHARLLVFTTGPKSSWIAYPSGRAVNWLAEAGMVVDGGYQVDANALTEAWRKAGVDATSTEDAYVTSWLNVPAPAAPEAQPAPPSSGLTGDTFSQQVAQAVRGDDGGSAEGDATGRTVITPRVAGVAYDTFIDVVAGEKLFFFAAPDEPSARELYEILARTGMFDEITVRDREENLIQHWGQE